MNIIVKLIRKTIFNPYSRRFKKRRKNIFYKYLNPGPKDKILDFGGDDGSWMNYLISFKSENLYIADIYQEPLDIAKAKFGFKTILLDESGKIPFEDNYFDIVFCNSVIEHVTVNKNEMYNIKTNKEFRRRSYIRQKFLADEIRRVSKKYFVQTPYRHFIIESHTWLPSFHTYLPRTFQLRLVRFLNKYWIKDSSPDINLLTGKDLQKLFPDAKIIREKSLFLTKSIVALRS